MINIENVTFGYKKSKGNVFNNFNLQLKDGSIYGLLGKNATGKSTLIYLLCGLLKTAQGKITIDDEDVRSMSQSILSKIYLVPEEFNLPNVSFKDYINTYSPFYSNFSQEVLESCMKEFDLTYDMKLMKLSMGTKKKVLMSFALAAQTQILLMDEPTNGLDIPSKRQFRKVIASNMTEGRTIIISTHQVHDIEMLIDQVVIIGKKGLLLDASTMELSEQYTFGRQHTGEIIYREQSVDGEIGISRRTEQDEETTVNFELLFEYINQK